MEDFIFGTLATEESRLNHLRKVFGGVTHNHNRLPRDPQPGQPTQIFLTLGPSHPHTRAWVYWTNDGSDPEGINGVASNGYATPLNFVSSQWETFMWGYVKTFQGEIPAQEAGRIVRYRVAAGGDNAETIADDGSYYAYYVDNDPAPEWTKEAIIYQIFADRFFCGDPSFPKIEKKPSLKCNGTLRGITYKLDYLSELGVNCLWLTPVFPSPSYHGYDATSFYDINPRLGTKEDFKELIEQAHAHGMRILMDFVPNHWSNQHPNFLEACADKNSPFVKWYTFEEHPNKYKTFFGVKTLPQINLRYAPAREHVTEAAKYWLDFGVDGFRVDYCIGPTPDFYADFRKATRTAKAQSWTFGEAVDPPDSQVTFEGGMDGSLDFMLLEALRNTFAFGKWNARMFADFLNRHEAYFPASFSRPSFLDNHDMNRFLWVAQGDTRKLKLAALCQFSLTGAPVIYYGTEVGLSQPRDMMQNGRAIHEEGRMPMLWDEAQDKDLFQFYRELIAFRKGKASLREGARETVFVNDEVLAYRRKYKNESVVCVLNTSANAVEIDLEIGEADLQVGTSPECKVKPNGSLKRVSLPAYGGVLIQ
ncbi:MAG: alpha-glucosidase C-terminal domain-containing protein [Anaerolineales bacterium]|nr:alpha-glucosidase C-terminal domain-containing protein [Anaerolineales bacterium]